MEGCYKKYIAKDDYNSVRFKVFSGLRAGFDYESWIDDNFTPNDADDLKAAIKKLIGDTEESRTRAMNILLGTEPEIEGAFGPRFQVGQANVLEPTTIVVEDVPLKERRTDQLGIKGAFLAETSLSNPIAAYGQMVSDFKKNIVERVLYDKDAKRLIRPDSITDALLNRTLLNQRLFEYKLRLINDIYEKLHGDKNHFGDLEESDFENVMSRTLTEYQNKQSIIDPSGELFATYMVLKNFDALLESEFKNVIRIKSGYENRIGIDMYEFEGGKVEYDSSWGDEYADASDYSGSLIKVLLEYFHGREPVSIGGKIIWRDTDKSIGFATFSNLMTRVKEWAETTTRSDIQRIVHGDINTNWANLIDEFLKDNKRRLTTDEISALEGIKYYLLDDNNEQLKTMFVNQAKKTVRYRYLTVKPRYNPKTGKVEMTTIEMTDRLVDIQNFRFQNNIKNAVFRFRHSPKQYQTLLNELGIRVEPNKITFEKLLSDGSDFEINITPSKSERNTYEFTNATKGFITLNHEKVVNLIRAILGVPLPSDINTYVNTMPGVSDLFSIFMKPLALTLYASNTKIIKESNDKSNSIYFDNGVLVTFPYTAECDFGARLLSKIYGTTDTNVIRNEKGNALPSYQIISSVYEVKQYIWELQHQSKLRGGLHDGTPRKTNVFSKNILARKHNTVDRTVDKTPIGQVYTRGDVMRNNSTKSSNQLTSKETYHLEVIENFLKRLNDSKSIILQPIVYSDKKTHFLIEYNIDSIYTLEGDCLKDVIANLISTSEKDRLLARSQMLREIKDVRGDRVRNQLIDIMSRYQKAFELVGNQTNWNAVSINMSNSAIKENIDFLRNLLDHITSIEELRDKFNDIDLNESLDVIVYKDNNGNNRFDLNTTLLHEAEMYLFDDASFTRYWNSQRLALAKSLAKVGFKFDAFFDGSLTTEYNKWKGVLGNAWFDDHLKTMKAYIAFDENGNEVDISKASRVELHPIIEAYMLSDGLLSNSFNELLFGATNGFANKYKGTALKEEELRHTHTLNQINHDAKLSIAQKRALIDDENERYAINKDQIYIEFTAAQLGDEFKRTVLGGAIRTPYAQGLKYGVSSKWKVAVVDDAVGYSYNYLGENAKNDANDGSGVASPYVSMQENESLRDGAVGRNKKTFINYTDPATGTLYEIKWAEFADFNQSRRGSDDVERRFQLMHRAVRINAKDMIGFNISKFYNLNDVFFDPDDKRKITHNEELYYKDVVTGLHYRIDAVSSRMENGRWVVDVTETECDSNKKFGRQRVRRNIPINYIADLDAIFGGRYCEKYDDINKKFVYSDSNLEIVNNIICNYNLKDHFIAFTVNRSAFKVGGTNINNSDVFSINGAPSLKYIEIGSNHAGVQMNADHEIDEASVSEMSQMISALIQNGYAKSTVDKVYELIGSIALKNIERYTKVFKNPDSPTYDKDVYIKIGKIFASSFISGNKDSIGLAEAFIINAARALQFNDDSDKIPFSSNQVKGIFQATITATFNKLGIRRKFPGFGGVNTPSFGQMQLYKIGDRYGFMDELQDNIRQDLITKQQSGEISTHWNCVNVLTDQMSSPETGIIDNPYITKLDSTQNLEMEDTIVLRKKMTLGQGIVIRIKDLKTLDFIKYIAPDTYDVFVWNNQPRELRQAQDTVTITNGTRSKTINWTDLDWIRASHYLSDKNNLPDLPSVIKQDTDYIIAANRNANTVRNNVIQAALQGSGIDWINGTISDDIRQKLVTWDDAWTIEQKRKALQKLALYWTQSQIQNFAKRLSTEKSIEITTPVSLVTWNPATIDINGNIDRGTVLVGNYKKAPGQIITGRANAKALGLQQGDSIADIARQGSSFFKDRLIGKFTMPKRSEIHPDMYDAVLFNRDGSKTIVIIGNVSTSLDRLQGYMLNKDYQVNSDWMYEKNDEELFSTLGKAFYKTPNGLDVLVVEDEAALKEVLDSKVYSHIRYNYRDNNWKNLLKFNNPKSFSGDTAITAIEAEGMYFTASDINGRNLANTLSDAELEYNISRLERLARKQYNAFEAQLNYILTRIPSQSMQSFMDVRVETWTDSLLNEVYVPRALTWIQGSDYDIDKDYMLGFGLLSDGTLPTLSDLENIDGLNTYDILLLNAPSGRTFVAGEATVGQRNRVTQAQVDSILYDDITGLNRFLSSKSNFIYFDPSVKKSDRKKLINLLNTHEHSKRNGHVETVALQNTVVRNILQVLRDPATQINMGKPITMNQLHRIADESTLAKDEKVMTLDNSFTKFMMQEQNMVGREVIGIGAVSLKHFFAASTFMNKQVSEIERILEAESDKSKVIPYIMDLIYNSKFDDDILTLANINFDRLLKILRENPTLNDINYRSSKTIEEAFGNKANSNLFIDKSFVEGNTLHLRTLIEHLNNRSNGTWDSPIDAASALSELISAATDNAKELILSKINASTKFADIYTYLIGSGMSFQQISDIMMSPIFNVVAYYTQSDLYDSTKRTASLENALQFVLNRKTLDGVDNNKFVWLITNVNSNDYKGSETSVSWINRLVYKTNSEGKPIYQNSIGVPEEKNNNFVRRWYESRHPDIPPGTETISDIMREVNRIVRDKWDNTAYDFTDDFKSFLNACYEELNNPESLQILLNMLSDRIDSSDTEYEPDPDTIIFDELDYLENTSESDDEEITTDTFEDFDYKTLNSQNSRIFYKYLVEYVVPKNKIISSMRDQIPLLEQILDNVIPGTQEQQMNGQILGINQGLNTDDFGEQNWIRKIENFVNQRYIKSKLKDAEEFNFIEFLTDDKVRARQIATYEKVKSNINILKNITNIPNFWAMLQIAGLNRTAIERSAAIRIERDLVDKVMKASKSISNGISSGYFFKFNAKEYKELQRVVSDSLVFSWVSALNDLNITVPKGCLKYTNKTSYIVKGDEEIVSVERDGAFDFLATFKNLMDNYIIPKLIESNPNNEFYRNLTTGFRKDISGNAVTFWKPSIDLSETANSPKLASLYEPIARGFNEIVNEVIPSSFGIGAGWTVGNLFYLYNILVHRDSLNGDSFTKLFEELTTSRDRSSFVYSYNQFLSELDNGKYRWTQSKLLNDSGKESPNGNVVQYGPVYVNLKDVRYRCTINSASENKFRVKRNLTDDERYVKSISMTDQKKKPVPGGEIDLTKQNHSDYVLNLPFMSNINHSISNESISIDNNKVIEYDCGSIEILDAIIENVRDLAGVSIPIEIINNDILMDIKNKKIQSQIIVEDAMFDAHGFVLNGKIYINSSNISLDSPVHELAHIMCAALKYGDSSQRAFYYALLDSIKKDSDEWNNRIPEWNAFYDTIVKRYSNIVSLDETNPQITSDLKEEILVNALVQAFSLNFQEEWASRRIAMSQLEHNVKDIMQEIFRIDNPGERKISDLINAPLREILAIFNSQFKGSNKLRVSGMIVPTNQKLAKLKIEYIKSDRLKIEGDC